MNATITSSPSSSKIHWYSVIQFCLSAITVITLWGLAATLALTGIVTHFNPSALAGGQGQDIYLMLLAGGLTLAGLLVLPSAGYALARLLGKPAYHHPALLRYFRPTLLILLLPFVLLAGAWIARQPMLAWLILPPFHVLAVGLPVLWLVYLGLRRLPSGSPQRAWGVFASGAILGPSLIMVAEIGAAIILIIAGSLLIASNPDWADQLRKLADQLRFSPTPDMVQQLILPYLTSPGATAVLLVFFAVIVPLIEELIKPIGVWLLISRPLRPADGFSAGVLSGAGYALFESLALSSRGSDWASIIFARIGTDVIHIFTAGLMGAALALAWREKRYLRLGIAYLCAVMIHGLWNGLTMTNVAASLATQAHMAAAGNNLINRIGQAAPVGLTGLAIITFICLLAVNRRLSNVEAAEQVLTEQDLPV